MFSFESSYKELFSQNLYLCDSWIAQIKMYGSELSFSYLAGVLGALLQCIYSRYYYFFWRCHKDVPDFTDLRKSVCQGIYIFAKKLHDVELLGLCSGWRYLLGIKSLPSM